MSRFFLLKSNHNDKKLGCCFWLKNLQIILYNFEYDNTGTETFISDWVAANASSEKKTMWAKLP